MGSGGLDSPESSPEHPQRKLINRVILSSFWKVDVLNHAISNNVNDAKN